MIGCYVNTHFSGLSVTEIVPYTHIMVTREVPSCLTEILLTWKYSPIKDHLNLQVKKDQAIAAIHSQNTTVENHLKYH
jgi:hypothetical protein